MTTSSTHAAPFAHAGRARLVTIGLGIAVIVAACGGAPTGSTLTDATTAAGAASPSTDPGAATPVPTTAGAASPGTVSSAGPAPVSGGLADDARRTVALLDELASMTDPTLEQTVAWFDKAFDDPIADQTIPEFAAYIQAREEYFQAIQYGESTRLPLADLLATRNAIAALAGIAATSVATAAPTPKPDRATYRELSKSDWTQLVGDPERFVGGKYVVAACIAGPVSLETIVGQAWYEWKQAYWEGNDAAFTADEDVIRTIVVTGKRLSAYVTVLGLYTLDTGEQLPHFQIDDREEPRDCIE